MRLSGAEIERGCGGGVAGHGVALGQRAEGLAGKELRLGQPLEELDGLFGPVVPAEDPGLEHAPARHVGLELPRGAGLLQGRLHAVLVQGHLGQGPPGLGDGGVEPDGAEQADGGLWAVAKLELDHAQEERVLGVGLVEGGRNFVMFDGGGAVAGGVGHGAGLEAQRGGVGADEQGALVVGEGLGGSVQEDQGLGEVGVCALVGGELAGGPVEHGDGLERCAGAEVVGGQRERGVGRGEAGVRLGGARGAAQGPGDQDAGADERAGQERDQGGRSGSAEGVGWHVGGPG